MTGVMFRCLGRTHWPTYVVKECSYYFTIERSIATSPYPRTSSRVANMGHGDNRETLAQAMYGKSEDDMTEDEKTELTRIIAGEAPTEEQAEQEAAQEEKQVASEENKDTAENLEEKLNSQIIYRPPHTETPTEPEPAADISVDDLGSKEYMSTGRAVEEAEAAEAAAGETEQKA